MEDWEAEMESWEEEEESSEAEVEGWEEEMEGREAEVEGWEAEVEGREAEVEGWRDHVKLVDLLSFLICASRLTELIIIFQNCVMRGFALIGISFECLLHSIINLVQNKCKNSSNSGTVSIISRLATAGVTAAHHIKS